ncbi:hypothetical protein Tco_0938699 [Tanacetum coccineum]|uniref:Uncharacterized protein n=1 Tax=Tanacetum coccineum TaxID=301880 RepID=A0ABQ5DP53_9ASTR
MGKKDVSKQGRKHLKTQSQFGEDAFDDINDLVDEGMVFVQEKDAENQGKIINTAGEGVSTAVFLKRPSLWKADYELAARMTQEEQEKYTIEERARLLAEFFERRKKQLAAKRAEAIKNKPPTKTHKVDYEPQGGGGTNSRNSNCELGISLLKDKEKMYVYKLTIADGSSSYLGDTQAFLKRLDRQDLNDLYSCGVYTLFMEVQSPEINMLVEKKYPLIKELLEKMLNLQLEAKEESTMAFELIKFIKSLLEE